MWLGGPSAPARASSCACGAKGKAPCRPRRRSLVRPPTQRPLSPTPPPPKKNPAQLDPDDDGHHRRPYDDPRFDAPPEEVPYASVALALFLLVFGAASLSLAWLHWTQELFGKPQAEWGFSIMGLLTVVPGAYHSWIAACCALGVEGYRWSDIPSYS
jgi:hypothetical protein